MPLHYYDIAAYCHAINILARLFTIRHDAAATLRYIADAIDYAADAAFACC